MRRTTLLAAVFVALLVLAPAFASQAVSGQRRSGTPAASPVPVTGRLDLAAMALTAADLPPGYVLARFAGRYHPAPYALHFAEEAYFRADQLAHPYYGTGLTAEALARTGLRWDYESVFAAPDGESFIRAYVQEYDSPDGARAGFDLFEDETGTALTDLPGPGVGEAPAETTVGTWTTPFVSVQSADATFRVGRLLAGVSVDTFGANAPDPRLAQRLAGKLARRIEQVLAGTPPLGIDPALPALLLPIHETWTEPGVFPEGYRGAAEFLGTDERVARLAGEYRGGYVRTASVNAHEPAAAPRAPFVTVAVASFASPRAAAAALSAADGLPLPAEVAPGVIRWPATPAERPETELWAAYATLFRYGDADSARVGIAVGARLALIDVQGAASFDLALAAAVALASQQATCLAAVGPCGSVTVPPELGS